MENMEAPLAALRDGKISYTQFELMTRLHWMRLARHLIRRWPVPVTVGVDDVVQEMLMAVWLFLGKWEPDRGPTLERFVVWNAVDKAKKWIHRERGAGRHRDTDQSRSVRSLDAMEPGWETRLAYVMAPVQEHAVHQQQTQRHLLEVCTVRDEFLLRTFMEEKDADAAADVVYSNPKLRLAFRFNCEGDARSRITKAARTALRRAEHG